MTVVVVSGGLDSVVLAHDRARTEGSVRLLSFDYGQRHRRELDFARRCATRLGARHDVLDLRSVGRLLGDSALTDDVPVPYGHYAEESMRATIVPNRNAILLIACGVAFAEGHRTVTFGAHGDDQFIYPDCREPFVQAFQTMIRWATDGQQTPAVVAPFLGWSKAEIVCLGAELGVPFAETWSCYEGGAIHCGRCGTCYERREAFELAGVPDPTSYAVSSWCAKFSHSVCYGHRGQRRPKGVWEPCLCPCHARTKQER